MITLEKLELNYEVNSKILEFTNELLLINDLLTTYETLYHLFDIENRINKLIKLFINDYSIDFNIEQKILKILKRKKNHVFSLIRHELNEL